MLAGLEAAESVEQLAATLPGALARAARAAGAVLWLADEPGGDLVPRGVAAADRRCRPPAGRGGVGFPPLPASHALSRWLARVPVARAGGRDGTPAVARAFLREVGLGPALGLAAGPPGRRALAGAVLLAGGTRPVARRRLGTLAREAALVLEAVRQRERLAAARAALARADRLATLGTLTASLAHELKNPLVAIKTFAQLLPERYDDPEFRTGFADIAIGEVERASALVGELLEFVRSPFRAPDGNEAGGPAAVALRPEDVNAILAQMLSLAEGEARRRRVRIVPRLDPSLPPVPVDPDRMKQLFLNLLLNAVEAIEGGGEVVVETAVRHGPDGVVVAVEVRDTGAGIAPADLPFLFTPFFSRKPQGVGLGLAVCREIVRAHGGDIGMASEPGRGTTVSVRLPLDSAVPAGATGARARIRAVPPVRDRWTGHGSLEGRVGHHAPVGGDDRSPVDRTDAGGGTG